MSSLRLHVSLKINFVLFLLAIFSFNQSAHSFVLIRSASIKKRHKFKYDLHAILTDLIYARILSPSSKLSSYDFCKTLLEPPKYNLSDVYRALSVIAEESDFIQSELYKNSISFIHEIKRSFIMTVRIITLRLKKAMILDVTEKVKNIVRILSSQWDCLWMPMEFLWLSISFLETRMNRQP